MYYPPPEKKQYSDSFIIKQILSWVPFGVPGFILFPQARLILFGTLLMGIYAAVFRYKLRDFFKKLTIETYNTLIDAVFDYKLKKEYYEDAALWVRATYDPVDFTPIKRVFAFILIAVPMGIAAFSLHFIAWIPELTIENAFQIVFPTEFNIENYSLLLPIESISEPVFLFLTYFGVISTLIFYAWVIYWTIHLYILFFMNNSILHHFTFWDQIDDFSKLPKGNVVGHFFTLNLFFWNLSNVILLNPILGIVTALSGWVYSQTNPRYNYFTGMKKPYKYLFLSQYPLLLIGWAIGTVQNYRVFGDWLFPTTMLIVVILFLIILTRLFVMEVDAFDLEKIKPIWRKVGDKLNIKSRKLIVLINLSPVLLFVVVQYIYNPIRVMIFPELDTSLGLNADQLWALGVGSLLMVFASSAISLELLKMEQGMRVIALGFLPKIKPHKIDEHKFHYWECFSSPIATLFAITIGCIFLSSMYSAYLKMALERSGWALFAPVLIIVYFFGATIGVLIWQIINGVHYIWHCLVLTVPFGEDVPEDYFKPMIKDYRAEIEGVRRRSYNILIANIVGVLGLVLVIELNPYYAIIISSLINFAFLYVINMVLDKIIDLKPGHNI